MQKPSMPKEGAVLIPGTFFAHIVDLVDELGGDGELLFQYAQLDKSRFRPQLDFISESALLEAVRGARRLCQKPEFNLLAGNRFSVSSFGALSAAVISCKDLEAALQLLVQFSTLAMPIVRFELTTLQDSLVMDIAITAADQELEQVIVEAYIGVIQKSFSLLLGRDLPIQSLMVTYSKPSYFDKYQEFLSCPVMFNADSNQMSIDIAYRSMPFLTANDFAAKMSLEQCEMDLAQAGQDALISHKVSSLVRFYLERNPGIVDIADKLNYTERTLRRRLSEEGTSYRELMKDVRHQAALYYLGQTNIQISKIAEKLGYQELSNFRTAFKSWQNCSPREWRNTQQESQ